MSHSLRAVTRLLPNAIGAPLWLALTALCSGTACASGRATPRCAFGSASYARLSARHPHVIVYDVTLLALPLVWFGAYMLDEERRADAPAFGVLIYWLFAALFIPTAAAIIGVQASVPLMMALLVA